MQVLVFELGACSYILKVGEVKRILAPAEPLPVGVGLADLGTILALRGLPSVDDPHQGFRALMAAPTGGSRLAIRMGSPIGAVEVAAEWILPLPGYMFLTKRNPFRGILDVPERRFEDRTLMLAQRGFMLDGETLTALALDSGADG